MQTFDTSKKETFWRHWGKQKMMGTNKKDKTVINIESIKQI